MKADEPTSPRWERRKWRIIKPWMTRVFEDRAAAMELACAQLGEVPATVLNLVKSQFPEGATKGYTRDQLFSILMGECMDLVDVLEPEATACPDAIRRLITDIYTPAFRYRPPDDDNDDNDDDKDDEE